MDRGGGHNGGQSDSKVQACVDVRGVDALPTWYFHERKDRRGSVSVSPADRKPMCAGPAPDYAQSAR